MTDIRFSPTLSFQSTYDELGNMPEYEASVVKDEPMLFSSDVAFAQSNAGPITQDFLDYLDPEEQWIIDSRVHMLMPGWYPCIPGWHHDDVIRNRPDGQPNYFDTRAHLPMHVAAVVDATDQPTGSLTEFLNDEVTLLSLPGENETLYGFWNYEINHRHLNKEQVDSGQIVAFGTSDFHRGMPAKTFGWRYFARATKYSTREITNEMRRQVQTYLPAIEGGW